MIQISRLLPQGDKHLHSVAQAPNAVCIPVSEDLDVCCLQPLLNASPRRLQHRAWTGLSVKVTTGGQKADFDSSMTKALTYLFPPALGGSHVSLYWLWKHTR